MTPQARVADAIEIIDRILAGSAAEQALTNWARGARYAGSKDRAAVRDWVFDALRCWRSAAWMGGAETGRGILLGLCRLQGLDPAELFTGARFAPAALSDAEQNPHRLEDAPEGVRLDMPDWLLPQLRRSLGAALEDSAASLRARAPVFVRVNGLKTDMETALRRLAEDEITARPHALAPTALEVTQNARRVARSAAYLEGLVELQDAASQAVVAALPDAARVLDYCAGGGGKSLALAARGAEVWAHDAAPARMADLGPRAERAGARITQLATPALSRAAPFDLVVCDVPCSGSGAWRRSPEGKWRLTPDGLEALLRAQAAILDQAALLVAPEGALAYVTCSLLADENGDQIDAFLRRSPGWQQETGRAFLPSDGGDGFFVAVLRRA